MNRRVLTVNLLTLVAIAGVVYIHREYFGEVVKEAQGYLIRADMWYILAAVVLYFISVGMFALRWKTVLKALGYSPATLKLSLALLGSIAINNITPASRMGGEPFRILWLRRSYKIPLPEATASIVYERIVEAIPVLILGLYAFSSRIRLSERMEFFLLLTGTTVFVGYRYLSRHSMPLPLEVRPFIRKLNEAFTSTLALSGAVWLMDLLRLKLLAKAVGVAISFKTLALISITALLLGLIPVTPAGIGIVDGGMFSVMVMSGISSGAAASIVALERFVSYFLSTIAGVVSIVVISGVLNGRI